MRWVKSIAVAMLVWGSRAFADSTPDLQRISSWLAYFDQTMPELNVQVLGDPSQNAALVLQDLENLDHAMIEIHNGHAGPASHSFVTLACGKPVCLTDNSDQDQHASTAAHPIQVACAPAVCLEGQ